MNPEEPVDCSSCMDLSPDARSKAAWTVMYSAFCCPGVGGPGWDQHSGLRPAPSEGHERRERKSVSAPGWFQAILAVLALEIRLRAGSTAPADGAEEAGSSRCV